MSILEYKGAEVITREELIDIIKRYVGVRYFTDLIERLQMKKRLISIKRGLYLVVPLSSVDKNWSIDEYKIVHHMLKQDYYIGLWNALNLHGITEQIPNKTYVFNTKISASKNILNHNFKFFKIKKENIFGIENKKYPFSDKERTIIDAIDYSDYVGNLSKVLSMVKGKYNRARLVDHAIRYDSVKVMKIVGYLTNSSRIYKRLNNTLSYYTTVKRSGTKLLDKKWKIRLI